MQTALDEKDVLNYIKSGKSVVTIQSETGKHFTYKFIKPKRSLNDPNFTGPYWIKLLNGSDNYHDYTYIGYMNEHARFVHGGEKSNVGADAISVKALSWVLRNLGKLENKVQVFHEGRCGRCGRKLTEPESLKTGIGPHCRTIA